MCIRVLLMDDQTLVREAICCLLKTELNADVREVSTPEDASRHLQQIRPQLIIIAGYPRHASLSGLIKEFRSRAADVPLLVLGGADDGLLAARTMAAGVTGFLSTRATAAEFISAVKSVASGRPYIDAHSEVLRVRKSAGEYAVLKQLTLRQADILRALGQGQNLNAIAERMGISYKTVANTCAVMKNKLGLKKTSDLRRLAISLNRA